MLKCVKHEFTVTYSSPHIMHQLQGEMLHYRLKHPPTSCWKTGWGWTDKYNHPLSRHKELLTNQFRSLKQCLEQLTGQKWNSSCGCDYENQEKELTCDLKLDFQFYKISCGSIFNQCKELAHLDLALGQQPRDFSIPGPYSLSTISIKGHAYLVIPEFSIFYWGQFHLLFLHWLLFRL